MLVAQQTTYLQFADILSFLSEEELDDVTQLRVQLLNELLLLGSNLLCKSKGYKVLIKDVMACVWHARRCMIMASQ